jgi:hypothetical protein
MVVAWTRVVEEELEGDGQTRLSDATNEVKLRHEGRRT